MEKTWHKGERCLTIGLSLNSWAFPLHVDACKPYTHSDPDPVTLDERWAKQVIITVLCFYVGIEW